MPHDLDVTDSLDVIILAGGQATRMGGIDKGLVSWRGKPLIEHVLACLYRQQGFPVRDIWISANRSLEAYKALGVRGVVEDVMPDFPGPLVGILSASQMSDADWFLIVPCDSPCLPDDLLQRLWAARVENGVSVAVTGELDAPDWQSAVCLAHKGSLPTLAARLQTGKRSLTGWQQSVPHQLCHFAQVERFANFNTLEDLE